MNECSEYIIIASSSKISQIVANGSVYEMKRSIILTIMKYEVYILSILKLRPYVANDYDR